MTEIDADWRAEMRAMRANARLWLRPDAHLWIRHDADRFMHPGWREKEARLHAVARGEAPKAALASEPIPARGFSEGERRLLRAMLDDYRAIAADLKAMREELEEIEAKARHPNGYDPEQPRWPAGTPGSVGGQWSGEGGAGGNEQSTGDALPLLPAIQSVDMNTLVETVLSDASPDPVSPWTQYADAQIRIDASALTGIETIDSTTRGLTQKLASVLDKVDYLPEWTPQKYGIVVHAMFALSVRLAQFPGIGVWDVETTFGLDDDAPYGAKGSIRTDVVLRNEVGDIIAIYDVKTGGARLRAGRVRELRARTGVGPNVPIIEMQAKFGIHGKMISGPLIAKLTRLSVQRTREDW
jgi:hypothetical protein